MSVLATLQSHGIELCSDNSQINCSVHDPSSTSPPAPRASALEENPLVSCLMVTRGNLELIRYSLGCYRSQTYQRRELVIVAEADAGDRVRSFIDTHQDLNVTVFVAPPGLT